MGGDAHDRFHRAREAPDRYGLAPHGPCRPFQGTQAGFEAQKERPPSLRRWPNFIKQRLCPALYNLGCRRHHFTILTRNSSIFKKTDIILIIMYKTYDFLNEKNLFKIHLTIILPSKGIMGIKLNNMIL